MRDESPTGAAPIVLVLAVTALTLRDLFGADRLPAYRDLLTFVLPLKFYLAQQLKRGEIPLWNPFIEMGEPFLAAWQTGVLYPPSLLLLLPFPVGFKLFLLAHYIAAVLGAWLYLRERPVSSAAAALGALTFGIGGYLVSMMNVTNHLQAAAWTPWMLFAWQRYRRRGSRSAAVAVVSFLCLLILGGAPETFLMALAVLGASTLYESLARWGEALRHTSVLGIATVLALGICAFQLVPTFEYFGQSVRNTRLTTEEVTLWSLQPVSLLQLLLPHSWNPAIAGGDQIVPTLEGRSTWLQSLYLGLVPLTLAVAGAVRGRERILWGGLVFGSVLMALGRYGPFFPTLLELAPAMFGRFRFPEKFFFIVHLGAAVLVAEGADAVLRRDRLAVRVTLVTAATFAALASALLLLRWLRPADYLWTLVMLRGSGLAADHLVALALDIAFKCVRIISIVGALGALFWLRGRRVLQEPVFATLVVALAAADLSSAHYNLNATVSWAQLRNEPLLVDPAATKGHYVFHYQTTAVRAVEGPPVAIAGFEPWLPPIETASFGETAVRMWRAFALNQGIIHGIRDIGGGDGFAPSSLVFMNTMLSILPREKAIGLLRIYGVSHLIGSTPIEAAGIEQLEQPKPAVDHAYRVADPMPYAYMVSRLHVADSDLPAVNRLIRSDFEATREAVVNELPAGWRDAPDDTPGVVETVSVQSSSVRVDVATANDAFLVVNDAYYPGWEASIDGIPTPIHRTNAFVRGVAVPRGKHVVVFRYRPASVRIGAWISVASVLLSAGLIARFAGPTPSTRA